ncbi:hypothetical protein [Bradyrhizobium sp. DASA03120]|uniref:hypothetical protein n=1 Tax=Bradyrhizobium sp. SMVTL-02 TaxID=3395917 RepID=UPI003F7271F9
MSHRLARFAVLPLLLAVAVVAASCSDAVALEWGVGGPPQKRRDLEPIFQLMKARGLTQYRTGLNLTQDAEPVEAPMFRKTVALAKKYSITLHPLINFPFRYGDRTDRGRYPKGDGEALYRQGYDRTYAFVRQFKDDVLDWELENEINLLALDSDGKKLFGRGMTAADFEMPVMEDWAQVLHGASDAIDRINRETGSRLRKVLNTTSTMLGFLDFMESRGVKYDVISYHYYEVAGQNPRRHWNGRNLPFDLFKKLASYRRPVTFNEVNCGEIYKPAYGNQPGDALTEQCLRSLRDTFQYLKNQKDVEIESIMVYELFDEPQKKPPENRFGLMYEIDRPKVALFLLTQFAGGRLSAEELAELRTRGL